MKVVKKTGLVPVHTSYHKRVFGVTPDVAIKGVADGSLILVVDIPDDIETFEYAVPKVAKKVEATAPEEIFIPNDWEEMHHLKRVKLAKEIQPARDVPDGKWTVEIADEVIREEIQRRAATEGEPTS